MDLIPSAGELSSDILGQQPCIASCHIYIHVLFPEIPVQNGLEAIKRLDLIKQQIIHPVICHLGMDIRHEFLRIDPTFLLLNLNKALPDQKKIIRRVKREADDMLVIHPAFQEVIIEDIVKQIGFAAPPDTGDHLDQSIMLPLYKLIQIEIPAYLHKGTSAIDFCNMLHFSFIQYPEA